MSSLVEAPVTSGEIAVGYRKERRTVETQEIRIRSTHRRRKVLTRAGVLVGFALAMVVYPVFGTIAPYADAAESLPGVVKGQSPTTAMALLGGGPQLLSSDLPVPALDPNATMILASDVENVATPFTTCDLTAAIEGTNGRLSASSLCGLWQSGESLQPVAADALTAMNTFYASVFGHNLCLDDSYRSLSDQYGVRATRGYLAATPGTSMHGWGLAIDVCKEALAGSSGKWLRANAAQFGWVNPSWAKSSKFEPWHWEFASLTAKYYDDTWGGGYSDGGSSGSDSSSTSAKASTTTTTTTGSATSTGNATPAPAPSVSPAP